MGYYTEHTLTIEPGDKDLLRQIVDGEPTDSELGYMLAGDGKSSKWYEHDDDMRELSRKWPNVIFHLHGEGDSNSDIWTATYQNGLCHHRYAQVTIEPFDPNKLE